MKKVLLMVFRLSLVVCACLIIFSIRLSQAQEGGLIGQLYDVPLELNDPYSEEPVKTMWFTLVFDINGDGRDDLGFTASQDTFDANLPFQLWTANQSGTMDNSTPVLIEGPVPVGGRGFRQIIPADFNGDGRLDLFLESSGQEPGCPDNCVPEDHPGSQNSLLLSNNDGKLTNVTTTHLPQYMDFSHGSSVADFDGDGDVDIWVNNVGASNLQYPTFSYLLHNDGQGHFSVAADIGSANPPDISDLKGFNGILPEGSYSLNQWTLALDADGDNDVDMNWMRIAHGEEVPRPYYNQMLINDGTGRFEFLPGNAYPSPGCGPSPNQWDPEICLHDPMPITAESYTYDFNLDGLQDMVLMQIIHETVDPDEYWDDEDGEERTHMQLLISNGDGTFRDESAERFVHPSVEVVWSFHLHDFDNDGQMDIISNFEMVTNAIYMNDGEGYFRFLAEDWIQLGGLFAVLDVDGDGGSDFVEPGQNGLLLTKMKQPYGPKLDGTSEDDRLIGGAHDNVYRGLAGNDVLDGGLGDDDLDGGEGDDELIGGKGDEWLTPGPGSNKVDGGPGRDLVEYELAMGDVEILPDEVTFISNGNKSVNDQVQNTEYALFTDAATPLPTSSQSAIASLNGVAGLWYDPSLDGEGFNVITAPSGTVIFFYGFNANSERLWLISETLEDGFDFEQIVDLQMYEGTGGTFDQPADPSDGLVEWGRLKMLFDACSTGRFALHGDDGVKTTYQIKLAGITNADCQAQTLSAPSGLAGLWYDAALNGEGYNIIITETATVVLFYGYGADGQRLWLISETMADAPVKLQMFFSTDGTFDEPLASSEVLKDWGELEVTFNSCGAALALLTGEDGEKTSNLEKLAGIDQSTCP